MTHNLAADGPAGESQEQVQLQKEVQVQVQVQVQVLPGCRGGGKGGG